MTRSVSDGNNSADRSYSHLQNHARPPPLLTIQDNVVDNYWKHFKMRWANYTFLSGIHDMPIEMHVAQLENCLDYDTLKTGEDLIFKQGKMKLRRRKL